MSMKVAAAIITGMMASPSSPSVKFTALAAPAMTKPPTTMKNRPSGNSSDLKNGTASAPDQCGIFDLHDQPVARNATPNSISETNAAADPVAMTAW